MVILLLLSNKAKDTHTNQTLDTNHSDPTNSADLALKTEKLREETLTIQNNVAERDANATTLMARAADCYAYIDQVKAQYAETSNAHMLMGRLQEMLFVDDIHYAISLDAKLQHLNPMEMLERCANGEPISDIIQSTEFHVTAASTSSAENSRIVDADSRREVVRALQEDINPVTEELVPFFEVLNDLHIDPEMEIELFKDIAMYLIMKTDALARYEGILEDLGEDSRLADSYFEEMDAIQSVFTHRITARHGRDPQELVERVDHLSIEKFNFNVLRAYGE